MEATSHRSQCYDAYLFQVPVIDEGLRYLLFKAQYLNPLEVVLKWWWLSGTVVKYSSLEGCITAWCQRRLQRCQISPVAPTVLGAASQSVVSPAGWYFRCVQIMQKKHFANHHYTGVLFLLHALPGRSRQLSVILPSALPRLRAAAVWSLLPFSPCHITSFLSIFMWATSFRFLFFFLLYWFPSLVSPLGWSTSTPAWWCLPIRSASCQVLTAVLWWRERTRQTWRMKSCTQNPLCSANSKP